MNDLLQELRRVVRSLARAPGFALTVILTLAVGLGANLAFFGYASYFLAPTIDAPEPARIVRVHTGTREAPDGANSFLDWRDLRAGTSETFEQLAAYQVFGSALIGSEKTLHAWGNAVSGEYFALFDRPAFLGRLLTADDDRAGAERVLVLNHFFWRKHFGGDPTIVGQTVALDGQLSYRVVGIATEGFQGDGLATSIYVPLASAQGLVRGLEERSSRRLQVLGRLRSGVSLDAARAQLAGVARGIDQSFPESEPRQVSLVPITSVSAEIRADPTVRAAQGLSIAVGLLLLLACANVANLVLARSAAQRRETAIQAALGAGRWRLGRRLLIEALVLVLAGGLLGLGFARAITRLIEHYLLLAVPVGMGDWSAGSTLIVNPWRLALFFAALCLGITLLVSLAPLTQVLRHRLVSGLKSHTEGDRAGRLDLRRLLVVVQVALSVVLLFAAGLLMRTHSEIRSNDLGFDPRPLSLVTLHIPTLRSSDNTAGFALSNDIVRQVQALPGVETAGLAWRVPLSMIQASERFSLPGSEDDIEVAINIVSPEYFEALRLAPLAGRSLSRDDRLNSPNVVVLNRAAAAQLFARQSPIGQRLHVAAEDIEGGQVQVVGVVQDSRFAKLADPIRPLIYFPYAQRFRQRMTLVVRSVRSDGPVARPLSELLRREFPDVAVVDAQPMSEQVRRAAADPKMNADLALGFGLFGLGLAALGIFSVLSYTVSTSSRAIGIRMALGASGRDITGWVLRGAGRLVVLGLALGLVASWATTRLLEGLLYGLEARDPRIAAAIVVVLALVGFVAALLPASRAARVEPVRAMRGE